MNSQQLIFSQTEEEEKKARKMQRYWVHPVIANREQLGQFLS